MGWWMHVASPYSADRPIVQCEPSARWWLRRRSAEAHFQLGRRAAAGRPNQFSSMRRSTAELMIWKSLHWHRFLTGQNVAEISCRFSLRRTVKAWIAIVYLQLDEAECRFGCSTMQVNPIRMSCTSLCSTNSWKILLRHWWQSLGPHVFLTGKLGVSYPLLSYAEPLTQQIIYWLTMCQNVDS